MLQYCAVKLAGNWHCWAQQHR